MCIRVILLGKTRNPHVRALLEDYCQRIARFAPVEMVEWRNTDGGPQAIARARGRRDPGPVVLLDAAGRAFTSQEFARWLTGQMASGRQNLVFLLGGAEGFSAESKRQADLLLSLSPLTLPHELARVVLLEQLYRAFALLCGHPYPK